MNLDHAQLQQLGKLRIPKVLFMPGEPMNKIRVSSQPSSPVKGLSNQTDIQQKLRVLQAEREAKQKLQEHELAEREKRCSFNRQAYIINKLHNVEQQLERWKRTRTNIEYSAHKVKQQSQMIQSFHQEEGSDQREMRIRLQQRNKSFSEFETRNSDFQKQKQKERFQLVNQTRYKNNIEQIDRNVRIIQKKYRTEKKSFTLRKAIYNINDFKNYSHFLLLN